MRVLVLGVSGMLGSVMLRVLAGNPALEVSGTSRSHSARQFLPQEFSEKIVTGIDVENHDTLIKVLTESRPEVVVNCIGLIKQLDAANNPLLALPINAMLPHRLAHLCALIGARLIHVSTDCVFKGTKGNYRETDSSDADDLYGKSKFLGEVAYPGTITLRTSIIGHELGSNRGLVDWFLAQEGRVMGYRHAIFSGLPTVELARVVRDIVLLRPEMFGLYHVASAPIAKLDLLRLIAEVYGKSIVIVPDDAVVINRSLNADRFRDATGYVAPPWPELVRRMYDFR